MAEENGQGESEADALNEEHGLPDVKETRAIQEATNEPDKTGMKAPEAPTNEPPKKELTAEEQAAADAEAKAKAEADEAAKKAEEDEAEKKKTDEEKSKEEAEKVKQEEIEKNEYPVYNDTAADSITAILKDAGVTVKEAWDLFGAAAENQTPENIDVAKLTEKVGKEKAALIMIAAKDFFNRNVAIVKETTDAVFEILGEGNLTVGGANYLKVQEWAHAKEDSDPAFAEQMAQLRPMFEAGKLPAQLATRELAKLYNADPKNKSLTISMTTGDKTGSNNVGEKGITRSDYVTQLTKAEEKGDKAEIARLHAARRLGMKQGL